MENTPTSTRPLAGKVALVTGASRGIGRATAERLSRDGATVVVNYANSAAKAEEVVAALVAAGGQAVAVQADMRQPADIHRLFEQTLAQFGRLDILVNNAGVADPGPLDSSDEALYAQVFDLNVRGVLLATQEAARRFGQEGGRIINLSSVLSRRPVPGGALYGASKAALNSLTQSWAAELGPRGITVNAVGPGLTETDMAAALPPEVQQDAINHTALGRLGRPDEIADVVAFLAGHDARWITGQTIYVDGGFR
jgi:3-oxoacyl-[acyl-carrier protein] reductase